MTFHRCLIAIALCLALSPLPAAAQPDPSVEAEIAQAIAMFKKGPPPRTPPDEWAAIRRMFAYSFVEEFEEPLPRVALTYLTELLGDGDRQVAVTAAAVLMKVDPVASAARARAVMTADLKGVSEDARQFVFQAIAKINPLTRDAEQLLVDEVRARRPMSWQAAAALQHVPADRIAAVMPVLVSALGDPSPDVRAAAARTLGTFGRQAGAARAALRGMLNGPPAWVAADAAAALVRIEDTPDPSLVPLFIAQLESDSVLTRKRGVAGLEAMGSAAGSAIPDLILLLGTKDSSLQDDIADLLGQLGPAAKAAVPALTKASEAGSSRAGAALRRLGVEPPEDARNKPAPEPSVADAIQLLRSPDAQTRIKALQAIHHQQKQAMSAVPALLVTLGDPDPSVRFLAASVLASVDPARAAPALPLLKEMLRSDLNMNGSNPRMLGPNALARLGRAGADALVEALGDPVPETRIAAAQGLMDSDDFPPAAVPALLKAARGEGEVARHQALVALVMRRPPAAQMVPPLIAALADPGASVRAQAAQGLGRYQAEARGALAALRKSTKDADASVRVSAATAMVMIDRATGPEFLPMFVAEFTAFDAGRFGGDFLEAERRLMDAAAAIGTIGPAARPALPSLIRAWERVTGWAQLDVGFAIARVDPASAKPVMTSFIEYLADADVTWRSLTLERIRQIGPAANATEAAVSRLTSDPDPTIRAEAVAALASIRGGARTPPARPVAAAPRAATSPSPAPAPSVPAAAVPVLGACADAPDRPAASYLCRVDQHLRQFSADRRGEPDNDRWLDLAIAELQTAIALSRGTPDVAFAQQRLVNLYTPEFRNSAAAAEPLLASMVDANPDSIGPRMELAVVREALTGAMPDPSLAQIKELSDPSNPAPMQLAVLRRKWQSQLAGSRVLTLKEMGPEPRPAPALSPTPAVTRPVQAVYPSIAQSARIQGVVILELRINAAGRVTAARVVRSIPLLDQAATNAAMQTEFAPTIVNGVAIPIVTRMEVTFTLR